VDEQQLRVGKSHVQKNHRLETTKIARTDTNTALSKFHRKREEKKTEKHTKYNKIRFVCNQVKTKLTKKHKHTTINTK
jgi:hypothetical protein